jgi:hypothetical protein
MEKTMRFVGNSSTLPTSTVGHSKAAHRIFLLSPANLKGVRGQTLLNSETQSALGNRLRAGGASLAELFCHTSSLYFRGKLAYARHFAIPPVGLEGCYVITSSRGLMSPDAVVGIEAARALAVGAEVDVEDDGYRIPLRRDAAALEQALPTDCQIVLLGSVATDKYLMPLREVFGRRLFFPSAFMGLGDMSRGGILLRCVRANEELAYISAPSHRGKSKPDEKKYV